MNWQDRHDIKFRPLERNAICRGCDKQLPKETKVIATYSFRNRGQHIYFCTKCVELMSKLIKELE
jgi:uncharacterized protein YlaI